MQPPQLPPPQRRQRVPPVRHHSVLAVHNPARPASRRPHPKPLQVVEGAADDEVDQGAGEGGVEGRGDGAAHHRPHAPPGAPRRREERGTAGVGFRLEQERLVHGRRAEDGGAETLRRGRRGRHGWHERRGDVQAQQQQHAHHRSARRHAGGRVAFADAGAVDMCEGGSEEGGVDGGPCHEGGSAVLELYFFAAAAVHVDEQLNLKNII